ncbi:MAG: hypothetical protein ABW224_13595 [Kibdelosporangium sp.]
MVPDDQKRTIASSGTNGSVARVAITGELNLATRHLVLRRLSTSSIVAAFT